MCVIFGVLGEKRPTTEQLQLAALVNRDGAGVAFYDTVCGEPTPRWEKGLDAEQVEKLMKSLVPPFMIHFRMASSGGTSPELTHPFPITKGVSTGLSGNAPAVLMHNGHWSGYDAVVEVLEKLVGLPPLMLPTSDSRVMAWIASHFGVEKMLSMVPASNRIAVMDKKELRIYNPAAWASHDDELWISSALFPDLKRHKKAERVSTFSSFTDNDEVAEEWWTDHYGWKGNEDFPRYVPPVSPPTPLSIMPTADYFTFLELKSISGGLFGKLIPRYAGEGG